MNVGSTGKAKERLKLADKTRRENRLRCKGDNIGTPRAEVIKKTAARENRSTSTQEGRL